LIENEAFAVPQIGRRERKKQEDRPGDPGHAELEEKRDAGKQPQRRPAHRHPAPGPADRHRAARVEEFRRLLGELESDALARRLEKVAIERPVFVTGLARAGTTMMLNVLSQAEGVATHRYRDFPFLFTPVAWNWFQDRLGGGAGEEVERPHRDRIRITKESAEAFEEPLWQAYFPWTHDPARCHVVDARTKHPEFEAAFRAHLRKILWLRSGTRYVSKGNYNVGRVGYLARLFPDARFVVPVRHPVAHVP
jgi:hypothetical protein